MGIHNKRIYRQITMVKNHYEVNLPGRIAALSLSQSLYLSRYLSFSVSVLCTREYVYVCFSGWAP